MSPKQDSTPANIDLTEDNGKYHVSTQESTQDQFNWIS